MIERIRGVFGRTSAKAQEKLVMFGTTIRSLWSGAVWPRITFRRLVDDGYGKHAIVFACVQFYVRMIRGAPLMVFEEDDVGERTPDAKHAARKLIRKPNSAMSEREFWAYWMTYAAVGGLVCVWKERARDGSVIGLWPLHRGQIAPIPSATGWVLGWAFTPGDGSKPVFIPPEDIIPWRWAIDPNSPLDALSVLYAIARAIDTGAEAMRYVYALLKNDAKPGTALVSKAILPSGVRERMLEQYREQYSGENLGMPMILEGQEAEIVRIGSNLQELGADTLHSVPDAWICAGFAIPPVLVYTSGGLQRSIQGAPKEMATFWIETVAVPMWEDIGDTFTRHLLWPDFGGEDTGFVMAFDLRRVQALAEDLVSKRKSVLDGMRMRLLTVNEGRIEDGKDPVDGGDVFLQPTGFFEVPLVPVAKEGSVALPVGTVATLSELQASVYGNKTPIEAVRALAVATGQISEEAAAMIFPDIVEEPPPAPTQEPPVPPQLPPPDDAEPDAEPSVEEEPPGAKALPIPSEVVIDESDIEDATRDWDRWAAKHAPDLVGMMNATVAKPKKGKR